jgi:hypothetical protein
MDSRQKIAGITAWRPIKGNTSIFRATKTDEGLRVGGWKRGGVEPPHRELSFPGSACRVTFRTSAPTLYHLEREASPHRIPRRSPLQACNRRWNARGMPFTGEQGAHTPRGDTLRPPSLGARPARPPAGVCRRQTAGEPPALPGSASNLIGWTRPLWEYVTVIVKCSTSSLSDLAARSDPTGSGPAEQTPAAGPRRSRRAVDLGAQAP